MTDTPASPPRLSKAARQLRLAFAGTPDFAAHHLHCLLAADAQVVAVYSQPDRPSGRGKKLLPTPVKAIALQHGIPVHQPTSLKDHDEQQHLRELALDVLVVVAYGLLLPKAVLDIPRHGCINVHASLLPRWRGAAPVERAILAGDRETGVTIMQMNQGLDTGDTLLTLPTPIGDRDNAAVLGERLSRLGCQGQLATLEAIATGTARATPQDEALACYAAKLSKQEALIDWRLDAAAIQRQVNAFFPRSPAFSFLNGERVRIIESTPLAESTTARPGTILAAGKAGLVVSCGQGRLLVSRMQLPGKTVMTVQDILNAHAAQFSPGLCFSDQEHSDEAGQ